LPSLSPYRGSPAQTNSRRKLPGSSIASKPYPGENQLVMPRLSLARASSGAEPSAVRHAWTDSLGMIFAGGGA
jgi:hypothetical protein